MISPKNSLQEFFQKAGMPVPTYETPPHNGGYISTVVLPTGKRVTGIQKMNKREAEMSAAERALLELKSERKEKPKQSVPAPILKILEREKEEITIPRGVRIFIDADQMNIAEVNQKYTFNRPQRIIAVCNKCSPNASVQVSFKKIIVDAGFKNAADAAIVALSAKFLDDESKLLILVSRDSFCGALRDLALHNKDDFGFEGKIERVTSLQELFSIFEKGLETFMPE